MGGFLSQMTTEESKPARPVTQQTANYGTPQKKIELADPRSPTQHLETNDDAKSRARTIAVAITSSSHGSISSSSSCLLNTVQ